MAGVEPVVGVPGVDDVDILWQQIVEPGDESLHGASAFGASRWATCPIACTPASVRPDPWMSTGDAEQLAGCPQQITLNGAGVLLPLPPVVACPLVLDGQTIAHGRNTTAESHRMLDNKGLPRKDVARFDSGIVDTTSLKQDRA